MGKSAHPITTRLGSKNIFWNSELYSYYYKNCIKNNLKVSLILERLFKKYGLSLLSFKIYFINNIFFILSTFKKFYWKYNCVKKKLIRNKKCPFLIKGLWKKCRNVQCIWFIKHSLGSNFLKPTYIQSKTIIDDEGGADDLNNLKDFIDKNRFLTSEKDSRKGYKKNYRKNLIEQQDSVVITNPLIRRYNIIWSNVVKSWYFRHWWLKQNNYLLDRKKQVSFNKNNRNSKSNNIEQAFERKN